MEDEKVKCPKCGSTQIHADKKGFSTGKAVIGTVAGGVLVGAAIGGVGSNKIQITCLKCGCVFHPGEEPKPKPKEAAPLNENQKAANIALFLVGTIVALIVLFTKGILWTALVLVIIFIIYAIMLDVLKDKENTTDSKKRIV